MSVLHWQVLTINEHILVIIIRILLYRVISFANFHYFPNLLSTFRLILIYFGSIFRLFG